MNQRFTGSALVQRLVHPRTGLQAIGYGKRGPIWPVVGAAEDDANSDDDGNQADDSKDDDSGDSGTKDDGGDSGKSKKAKAKKDEDDDERVYTAGEYNKLKARMQAADRNAISLQNRLKALEDKDKPEDEKLRADLKESLSKLEDLQEKRKKDLIQLAFLKANDVEWHDPEDALTMADLSEVEIDDDGNVDKKALKAALKDLAKRKPHLIKKSKKDEEDDEEEDDTEEEDQGSKPSGKKMAGKRKGGNKTTPTREDLAKRFPALNRR